MLLLGQASCSVPKNLAPLGKGKVVELNEANFKPIFKDNFKSFLFKTKMSYGDKFELGGMLMLKQLSEGNFRTIFMTKFGMTLFDFEFGKNGFVVHKALEQLDKKIFLKIIEEDIEMLLMRGILGNSATIFEKEQASPKKRVIKTQMNKKTHYFVQEKGLHFTQIHRGKSVRMTLSNNIASIPRKIEIQHHNIPLTMDLVLLKH